MNRQRYIVFILFLLFSLTSLQARRTELILQKAADDRYVPAIPVYLINEYQYISLQDLLDSYKVSAFLNPAVRKTVFRLGRLKFKVTAYNHYIMVEDKTFQMSHAVIFFEGKTYLPMDDFVGILKLVGLVSGVTILSGSDPADLQVQKEAEPMEFSPYDIMSAKIEERQNGTVIRIRTANRYDARSVKAWINRDEWLYVTLPSAKVNKPGLDNTKVPKNSSVRTVTADQLDGTSQLTFRLRGTVEGVDVQVFREDRGQSWALMSYDLFLKLTLLHENQDNDT